jgi:hypothetical protein
MTTSTEMYCAWAEDVLKLAKFKRSTRRKYKLFFAKVFIEKTG